MWQRIREDLVFTNNNLIVTYTSTTSKRTSNKRPSQKSYTKESEGNVSIAEPTADAINQPARPTVPELRIYRFFDKPIGPHPIAMFEVNLFTPAQFGAFIPWLVINRGPLSALVHPNSVDEKGNYIDPERDHTQRATVSWVMSFWLRLIDFSFSLGRYLWAHKLTIWCCSGWARKCCWIWACLRGSRNLRHEGGFMVNIASLERRQEGFGYWRTFKIV